MKWLFYFMTDKSSGPCTAILSEAVLCCTRKYLSRSPWGECRHLSCNKANLRDLIAATNLVILLKLDSIHRFFSLCDLEIWWMTSNKLDSNRQFFRPCDREIWWMTLQNNRAPLLYYFKLCASFLTHWWIQTWVTVRKRPIWVKFNDF